MKNPRWMDRRPGFLHVVMDMPGMPGDDCPVCRAHQLEPVEGGFAVEEILELEDLLNCPCPMCRPAAQALRRPKGGT